MRAEEADYLPDVVANILVLTSRWPFPPYSGDMVRVLNICEQLAHQQHRVTLLALSDKISPPSPGRFSQLLDRISFVHHPAWRSYLNCFLALFSGRPLQVAFYESKEFAAAVRELVGDVDVVLAHLLRTAEYVPRDFAGLKILEMTDAISLGYERSHASERVSRLQMIYSVEHGRIAKYEQACLGRFDIATVVSSVDRDHLLRASSHRYTNKILVATNGADPARLTSSVGRRGTDILFVGKLTTVPNFDACEYFAAACLPKIRAYNPAVRVKVVGPISDALRKRLEAHEGVVVSGVVEDLFEAAKDAFCGIAPMRLGAGIQNKLLDYMGMGLPAVTTSIGYEGLSAVAGQEILLADTPDEWFDAIRHLLESPADRDQLGERGRAYVLRHHRWDACLAPLLAVLDRRTRCELPPWSGGA